MILLGALAWLPGCDAIFGGLAKDNPAYQPNFAVTPAAATLLAGATMTFTAASGDGPASATWQVVEPGGGTVTPAGAYTAPVQAGVFHLRGSSVTDPARQAEAAITVVSMVTPAIIVSTGELPTATGHGTQSHLAYARGTGQWWLFRDPSGRGVLATLHSKDKDFGGWQMGAELVLTKGQSGDGRDLSVAYRQLNGHDIVHITQGYAGSGTTFGRYHIRAILSADQIAFGGPWEINSIPMKDVITLPDGMATTILPGGQVIDSTGYEYTPQTPPLQPCGTGDVDTYVSQAVDDGSPGLQFTAAAFTQTVLWCVPNTVNARQLLPTGDGAIQLYTDGTLSGDTAQNILTSTLRGGAWLPAQPGPSPITPPRVFLNDQAFGLDDWTATAGHGAVHSVRRLGSTFEHRIMGLDRPGDWRDGGSIPAQPTLPNSGLFLAPYGDGLVLLTLNGAEVRYTAFDGTSWSAWMTLCATGNAPGYLSGFAPDSDARPAVIWTQAAGASFAIAGALLP